MKQNDRKVWPNGVDLAQFPSESLRFQAEHADDPLAPENPTCGRCGIAIMAGTYCMRCATIRLVLRVAGQEVQ